jgi:hypothetical protein
LRNVWLLVRRPLPRMKAGDDAEVGISGIGTPRDGVRDEA